MPELQEAQFDGLAGPTHHYGGHAAGNLASQRHRGLVSRPRQAVLEGLAKAGLVAGLGVPQAILPPHERPCLATLRKLGFTGRDDAAILERAAREAPGLLAACSSSSFMWAANAATVTPSPDAADGRVHFTPANLVTAFHRSIEAPFTGRLLRRLFPDERRFRHHPSLPAHPDFGDEGAANHTRLEGGSGGPGLHLFVHGRAPGEPLVPAGRHPARQSRLAGESIARQHQLDPARVLHLRQSAAAIDAGVFHNDVIAVGGGDILLYHEDAYADGEAGPAAVAARFAETCGQPLRLLRVDRGRLSLERAVATYLFNSQLLADPGGGRLLLLPAECRENPDTWELVQEWVADPACPIDRVIVCDLRQSMWNGGGPACLRLRVPLTEAERRAVFPGVWLTPARQRELEAWARRHYRETLTADELGDPRLLEESRRALDELTQMLRLGSLYSFQRAC